ncbi:MAG TPA: LuxR C-terminal-related transcriptional regulator, partial [Actinophytocola sp.]|nr:LuxR C-terminal-related transcriptional regulator [Actinophytocola sp.]
MPPDAVPEPLRTAGVTARELEIFWLVADRLQNREIAERLHVSERTVESHVSSLLRKLGGTNRMSLVDAANRLRDAGPAPGGSLPMPLSSFVGRTDQVEDLLRLVPAHRLVTLTGPAGAGKTRLALQLAHAVDTLPAAVLVDLAPVPEPRAVERAFAEALGIDGDGHRLRAALRQTLAGGSHWLVVDNCEHVTAAVAALLVDLLAAASRLTVLATSHGPLRVAGEVVYPVPPLEVPPAAEDPAAVLDTAAARLFADRAAAASPGFRVDAGNARDVATVCRRLDGLPLAIELAAARVRSFSPAELVARLDDRFALLSDGAHGPASRHRTLEEALRWSYDLLDDGERVLLERCSVFPADFDYDTAVGVLAFPPLGTSDLARLFPRLLDRSLITARRRGQTTEYRLLDSIRQFAGARLSAREGTETVRAAFARYHLRHGVALLPDLRGGDQVGALAWFDRRWVDLGAAMGWALESANHDLAWEFVAGIGTGWEILGARGEVFDWL